MKGARKLFIFLVLSVLLITFTFYVYQICYTPNILVGKESQLLIIPNDATFETVQMLLHDGGYVQDLMSFSFLRGVRRPAFEGRRDGLPVRRRPVRLRARLACRPVA